MSRKSKKLSNTLLPLLLGFLSVSTIFLFGRNQVMSLFGKKSGNYPSWMNPLVNSEYSSMANMFNAMWRHETGNGTNTGYTKLNNPFSMGNATRRVQPGMPSFMKNPEWGIGGENAQLRWYPSKEIAAQDMLAYLRQVNFPVVDSLGKFASTLKQKGYYTDSEANYYGGLKAWV